MLILSITAAWIFQSGAAFCTRTCVSLMCPILPDSLTFCLQTLQSTSASLRIWDTADWGINNSICFMNAGEGVFLLWMLAQSKEGWCTLSKKSLFLLCLWMKHLFLYLFVVNNPKLYEPAFIFISFGLKRFSAAGRKGCSSALWVQLGLQVL